MPEPLALLARCLLLTLAIELTGARLLFRIRDADALIIVALAQIVTNPLVETGVIGACSYLPHPVAAVVVLELAAFVAEALIYRAKGIAEHPWAMALVLNALSFVAGLSRLI
ncbi:hypothetical protein EII22_01940 [Coriobacteriales bacterium OH1046]|nr:hypothetical protein EII22_01940 [Coriobacteriales bacterium OH1046]